jgi:uncharacterized membrane protein
MTASLTVTPAAATVPAIHHVAIRRPAVWLQHGWQDLRAIGSPALAHGALIALLGGILLILGSSHLYLVAAAVSGYLLVGPIMTSGLCELARRREAHETLGFDDSLRALERNPDGLLHFGLLLAAIALVWFALSALLLQVVFPASVPSLAVTLWGGAAHLIASQWAAYVGCGFILALAVFAMSVVAVPMLLDRQSSVADAVRTSARVVMRNLPVMLVWAALIVLVNLLGFVTLLLGMVIVAPVLGFATWHAYRDLVG